ncbi:DNA internalization-related competence protein ComEC/Rec2 [Niveibacterium terrae]|uniref:DNA internalization-related competence protein ComEC/Rec2 n=1 Tax=Niveibacterium terrae TaxID=3373598 RepID=UPI003A8CA20F
MPPVVLASLPFCLGIYWLQCQAELPPLWPAALPLSLAVPLCAFFWRRRPALARILLILSFLVGGAGWAIWRAELRLPDRLSAELEGRDLIVEGRVEGLPRWSERSTSFQFEVLKAEPGVPSRLLLAVYGSSRGGRLSPHPGERWRFAVRLKRPHGTLNPHGADFEAWMFSQGLGANGYVRQAPPPLRLAAGPEGLAARVDRLREAVRESIVRALPESRWQALLVALAVGDQRGVPADQWRLFARTGITHLVSISGLHVVIWAVIVGALVAALWRRVPALALRLPAQQAGALLGVVASLIYCALAGWGVPAQRSLLMLAVAAAARFGWRKLSPASSLGLVLLVVLVRDPWAVSGKGFWLSFGAVALLLCSGLGRLKRESALSGWLRAQWAMLLGMLPALLALTGQVSLVAPLANAVAIPVVTMLVLPLVLGFVLLPWTPLLDLASLVFDVLASGLEVLARPQWAVWQPPAPPALLLLVAGFAAIWLLLPRRIPGKAAAWALLLPLALWPVARPAFGQFELTLLDVGQGLAAHVRTRTHDLVFDAGPSYGGGSDAGQSILVPYLRGEGAMPLDALVISHYDSDHSGGAVSVVDAIGARRLIGSVEAGDARLALGGRRVEPCRRGQSWDWDGVRFAILNPEAGAALAKNGNTTSCVMKVSTASGSVFLAADADLAAEAGMLAAGALAPTTVLVAPHHGSHTSSGAEFITALSPRWVLYSVGYRNRFGHPHAEVAERYRLAGARALRTDRDGALRFAFGARVELVARWRQVARRYWQTEWLETAPH